MEDVERSFKEYQTAENDNMKVKKFYKHMYYKAKCFDKYYDYINYIETYKKFNHIFDFSIVPSIKDNISDINNSNLSSNGKTPLLLSAKNCHLEMVKILIKNKANVNVCDYDNNTPLLLCLDESYQEDHIKIAKLLIKNKANVNMKNKNNCSAIHYATETGSITIIKLLIENGANINSKDKFGSTPLKLLIDLYPPYNRCIIRTYKKKIDTLKLLLKNKANVNIPNNETIYPLHKAVWNNEKEVVKLLLEYNADPNVQTDDKCCMIVSTSEDMNYEIVKLLLEYKANPNIQNNWGFTSLMSASTYGNYKIVKLLLDHKANPNIIADNGKTALDYAIEKHYTNIAKLLK